MHILILTPGFPENEKDTDCIPPMQEFLNAFHLIYPHVIITVVSIHYPFKNNVYEYKGIKVFACGGKSAAQPLRLFYWLRALYYALKINSGNKIDFIHSFWFNETALIGSILRQITNAGHINTLMGQDARSPNKFFRMLKLKNIIKVAVSDFQADIFRKASGASADRIIEWGISDFEKQNIQRRFDVIGAGSLIPLKKFTLFIEVISELKKEFSSIKCMIIGEGIERPVLEKLIKDLNLSENITLSGQLKREEVLVKMQQSKILMHTSEYESFGYVIAEALASGCYVVSRKTGCAAESEKLRIAENKSEFVKEVSSVLKSDGSYTSCVPFKVEDTAGKYYDLYNSFLHKR